MLNKIATPVRLILLVALVLSLVVTALRGLDQVVPAYACSLGETNLDQFVKQADAAAIVYVKAVRGPENSAQQLTPVASPAFGRSSRTQPVDLTGYGASLQTYLPIFGDLPEYFEVDVKVREGMERGLRAIESGRDPPCPIDFLVARYLPRQYYLVLLEKDGSDWRTLFTFNHRVEGPDLLIAPVYEGEKQPFQLALRRPLFERFLPAKPARAFIRTIRLQAYRCR